MFPYRAKYKQSEYDIQNNDLVYKINQICKNALETLEIVGNILLKQKTRINIICISCIIHTLHLL